MSHPNLKIPSVYSCIYIYVIPPGGPRRVKQANLPFLLGFFSVTYCFCLQIVLIYGQYRAKKCCNCATFSKCDHNFARDVRNTTYPIKCDHKSLPHSHTVYIIK